jgi:hypothetical protein
MWSLKEFKMTDQKELHHLIPPHGGYRELQSYQMAEIVFDATVVFCDRFISRRSHTHNQVVQAARTGKQNIAGGGFTERLYRSRSQMRNRSKKT